MCGRITLAKTYADSIAEFFDLVEPVPVFPPLYNAGPYWNDKSPLLPVVIHDAGNRIELMRWGLISKWAKSDSEKIRPINARAETVWEKPMFKSLSHCLVIADGFYEWKQIGRTKQPYRFTMNHGGLFAMAGLWNAWKSPTTGEEIRSFTIVTTEANELMAPMHDRMPVIVPPCEYANWLSSGPVKWEFRRPYLAIEMTAYPVTTRVNVLKNQDASLVEPITL